MGLFLNDAEFDNYYKWFVKRGRKSGLGVRASWGRDYGLEKRMELWAEVGRLDDGQSSGYSQTVAPGGALERASRAMQSGQS